MMKKIAILTIVSDNCGNRLQNYALQETLRKMNCNVYTIRRRKKSVKYKIKQLVRSILLRDYHSACFWFNQKIKWAKQVIPEKNEDFEFSDCYDKYVIGSDQIWNVTFPFIGANDFLPCVPDEKKLSYAASFGIDEIPVEHRLNVKEWLTHISNISVREEAGKNIVENLTGKKAEIVLDPTLLLDASEWEKIEKKPKGRLPLKYIFAYILGDNSSVKQLKKNAEKWDISVIEFDGKNGAIGPEEFVSCIHHAEAIYTDSFHASVFSMIFRKKFQILRRVGNDNDMYSRLDTLCKTFELYDREYDEMDVERLLNQKAQYDTQEKILKAKRYQSLTYLDAALNK